MSCAPEPSSGARQESGQVGAEDGESGGDRMEVVVSAISCATATGVIAVDSP